MKEWSKEGFPKVEHLFIWYLDGVICLPLLPRVISLVVVFLKGTNELHDSMLILSFSLLSVLEVISVEQIACVLSWFVMLL